MKSLTRKLIICAILFLTMILIPLLAVSHGEKALAPTVVSKSANNTDNLNLGNASEKKFRVLDESTDKIIEIPDRDFIYGVVAAEMPAKFEVEALKAQAVASYTYFCRARNLNRNKAKNSGEKDYDFTINTQKLSNYISEDEMKRRWGTQFNDCYSKIKNAVDGVFGEVIESNGDLILAVYHAISSGKTEKSADVFGGELSYLTNVESPGDKLAAGYETTVSVEKNKMREILSSKLKNCNFECSPKNWIGKITRTEGGMVKEIEICSNVVKGVDIRNMFALRSSDFDIEFDEATDKFIFTVRGYGHGVGMSQRGAQYMAVNGKNYKEILAWYYPGTSASKLD